MEGRTVMSLNNILPSINPLGGPPRAGPSPFKPRLVAIKTEAPEYFPALVNQSANLPRSQNAYDCSAHILHVPGAKMVQAGV